MILTVRAHPDDPDQRPVVLTFQGCASAQMGAPNDEALHLHRLYESGLADVLWIGEVLDSSRIDEIAPMTVTPPPKHYILPLKEGVVEVLTESLTVTRAATDPPQAGTEQMPPNERP